MSVNDNMGRRKGLRLAVLAGTLFCLVAAAVAQLTPPMDEVKLSQQSTFVFHGTVEKTHASTMVLAPSSPSTVVVKVDSIVRSPATLASFAGKEVTVLLTEPDSLKEGTKATFFTQGWLIGSQVAVKELSHSISLQPGAAREMLANAEKKAQTQALKDELAGASLVITGQVIRVLGVPDHAYVSEHDPQWQDAAIQVSSVEKGASPSQTIHVLFPTSRDVAWANAPRFREGQRGIWILHKVPGTDVFKGAAPAGRTFTALSNSDFRSLEEIEAIRTLVK